MTKTEILEVVKRMLADWEYCYKEKHSLYSKCVSHGFCNWLENKIGFPNQTFVFLELKKDRKYNIINYWYAIYHTTLTIEALKPRIDHLKRTIARLEKEIETKNL